MVRRSTTATAVAAALAISILLPTAAAGDPVGDVLGGLGVGAGSGGGGNVINHGEPSGGGSNRAGTPPNYRPPLHGTNAHGEGTVAAVELGSSTINPYPPGPQGGNEEVVVGDSKGEQNPGAGSYHGRVTLIYLNPLGIPIANIFIDSFPGETRREPQPFAGVNDALQQVCIGSAGNACVAIVPMSTTTTGNSSSNSFALLRAFLLQGQTQLNVGTSSGEIYDAGGCQTANGRSSIINGNVGPGTIDVLSASSSSTACNNGAQSTQNSSSFVNLFGVTPPVPGLPGCGNLIPNSSLVLGPVGLVCHANDSNGGQTSNPYGVREAFTFFVILPPPLDVRAAISGPETHAIAPPPAPTSTASPNRRKGPQGNAAGAAAAGEVAGEVAAGDGDQLPFTGQNLLLLGLIGTGLVGLGLLGSAASRRRTI